MKPPPQKDQTGVVPPLATVFRLPGSVRLQKTSESPRGQEVGEAFVQMNRIRARIPVMNL